jgi:hypothetical protein
VSAGRSTGVPLHAEPPRLRHRCRAGFEQAALVELDVVCGIVARGDVPGVRVVGDVQEVATIYLDRVVEEQGVADSWDQGRGDLVDGAARAL